MSKESAIMLYLSPSNKRFPERLKIYEIEFVPWSEVSGISPKCQARL